MSGQDQDQAIQQWLSFTGGPANDARHYLEANEWNVEAAVDMWFGDNAGDQSAEPAEATPSAPSAPSASAGETVTGSIAAGGRTLAGGSAPSQPAASSSSSSARNAPSSSRAKPRGGMVTLGDLASSGGDGHGHAHDSDSDENHGPNQDFFAGGEKSGLAVQNPANPRDFIERIFQRAQENVPRPGGEEDEESTTHFSGRGQTLGGDDAPSRVVEDPSAALPRRLPRVTRTLHVWRNGFSIDDGPLRDPQADPENARILQMILNGHAPLDILNVEPGQEVDLDLDNQKEEEFVQPKAKYVAFGGSGQRLGETGSDITNTSSPVTTTTTTTQSTTSTSSGSASTGSNINIDDAQPIITLQIRLGNGTRLQSRFNTSHTIGDVYSFVSAASPASQSRAYVLSSTFPPKDFEDKSAVLGELAEFKRGGVVVQKWK